MKVISIALTVFMIVLCFVAHFKGWAMEWYHLPVWCSILLMKEIKEL